MNMKYHAYGWRHEDRCIEDSQIKINQLGEDNSTARLVPVNSGN